MNIPRRSFYHRRKGKSPDKVLESRIGDICLEFSGYGYRRVTRQLHREGWRVNHKKVAGSCGRRDCSVVPGRNG